MKVDINEIRKKSNGNVIIGKYPDLKNSVITFNGVGNILCCGENVRLVNSTITFSGNHSIIHFGAPAMLYWG